jgi:hypothetical protein
LGGGGRDDGFVRPAPHDDLPDDASDASPFSADLGFGGLGADDVHDGHGGGDPFLDDADHLLDDPATLTAAEPLEPAVEAVVVEHGVAHLGDHAAHHDFGGGAAGTPHALVDDGFDDPVHDALHGPQPGVGTEHGLHAGLLHGPDGDDTVATHDHAGAAHGHVLGLDHVEDQSHHQGDGLDPDDMVSTDDFDLNRDGHVDLHDVHAFVDAFLGFGH